MTGRTNKNMNAIAFHSGPLSNKEGRDNSEITKVPF